MATGHRQGGIAMPDEIRIQHVAKEYKSNGNSLKAVDDVSFDIRDSEFICLVGPSGCGKSTLLRMIAGLEPVSSGEILMGNKKVTSPSPSIGFVFQEYTLFPWRTVERTSSSGWRSRSFLPLKESRSHQNIW